jgi:hypothetical protein
MANLGTGKSGSGELAPKLWAKGEYAVVIEYCCLDVRLTKSLYDLIQSRGYLDNPKTGKRVWFRADEAEVTFRVCLQCCERFLVKDAAQERCETCQRLNSILYSGQSGPGEGGE